MTLKNFVLTALRFAHMWMIDVKNSCKKRWFQAKWRTLNTHNMTTPDTVFDMQKVHVGKGTYARLNVHSYGSENELLEIGNYCSIAENVHFILGGGHDYQRFSTYPFQAYYGTPEIDAISKGPIRIEDDVWIGFGATVLSGVTIGRGAVIAAGSIVTKNVPPYAVWIGGKVHRMRFSEDICEKLSTIDFNSLDPLAVRNSDSAFIHVYERNVDAVVSEITER